MTMAFPEWPVLTAVIAAALLLLAVPGILLRRYWLRRRRAREKLARLDGICFRRVSSVLIPDGNGGQLHLDHLLLSPKGLVVIAERDLAGVVFGSQLMDEWALMPSGRGARITFANPLRPLYDRIAAVGALAGEGVPVEGRVLFRDAAEFPKGHPPLVVRESELTTAFAVVDRGSSVPDVRWAIAFDQVTAHAVPGSPHLPTLDSLR
jgi:Nuclease-related domain